MAQEWHCNWFSNWLRSLIFKEVKQHINSDWSGGLTQNSCLCLIVSLMACHWKSWTTVFCRQYPNFFLQDLEHKHRVTWWRASRDYSSVLLSSGPSCLISSSLHLQFSWATEIGLLASEVLYGWRNCTQRKADSLFKRQYWLIQAQSITILLIKF